MKVQKEVLRVVLENLYVDSFPDPCLQSDLCKRIFDKWAKKLKLLGWSSLEVALQYLYDIGYVALTRDKDGNSQWRITAKGIDVLEGGHLI